jgi:FAD/FMN-containing dehydrogenase
VLDSGWWSPNDDETVHNATRNMIDEIETASKAEGDYVEYIFMNDASWDQEVIQHYGGESVERLKRVRKLYDPDSVFQRLVPGGFKLP